MANRATRSAVLVAGAAAAAVAATWYGKRRLSAVNKPDELSEPRSPSVDELVDRESAELPVGHSADPEIDQEVSRPSHLRTSGAVLRGELDSEDAEQPWTDGPLADVWNSLPGFAEGEQTEGYDAVSPEDLGAVWLERATQTTHDARPHASDPSDVPELDELVSSATRTSSRSLDDTEDEEEDDEIDDDELGEPDER